MRNLTTHLILLLTLALTSCAGMKITDTGFLDNYEQLEPAEDLKVWGIPDDVLFYESTGVDWSSYTSVTVPEVVWQRTEVDPHTELSLGESEKLTGQFRRRLAEAFGEDRDRVDRAGAGTLVVRAALTDVDRSIVWLNVLGWLLLVPPDQGGISCEVEILDGATNERLMAFAGHRDGTIFLALETFSRFGHAKHGMKKWATLLAQRTKP